MINSAKRAGKIDDHKLWKSIENVSELLEDLYVGHDKEYCKFLRKQHELLFGQHYDKEFARSDVAMLSYSDKNNTTHTGEHWSIEQIEELSHTLQLPKDYTVWDLYVAANVMYSDLCRHFNDEQIIQVTCSLFFHDEDYKGEGKIWEYMSYMI